MRLHDSAGHLAAGVFAGRPLRRPLVSQTYPAAGQFAEDETGKIWDPIKAAGGFGLIAILLASVWFEWQLVKWLYSLFV